MKQQFIIQLDRKLRIICILYIRSKSNQLQKHPATLILRVKLSSHQQFLQLLIRNLFIPRLPQKIIINLLKQILRRILQRNIHHNRIIQIINHLENSPLTNNLLLLRRSFQFTQKPIRRNLLLSKFSIIPP